MYYVFVTKHQPFLVSKTKNNAILIKKIKKNLDVNIF